VRAPPCREQSILGNHLRRHGTVRHSSARRIESRCDAVLKQTSDLPYGRILTEIVGKKGVIGMFDGFMPWGTVQAIAKGGVFGLAKAVMDKFFKPMVDQGSLGRSAADSIAACGAGGVQGYVLSPTLLLKTRVMTDPVFRQNLGPIENISKSFTVGGRVIRDEGVGSLMKGANIFAMKRVFDWGTRFAFSNMAEDMLFRKAQPAGAPKQKLTYTQSLIASTIGGTLSAASTVPLDVLVANIQQARRAPAGPSPCHTPMRPVPPVLRSSRLPHGRRSAAASVVAQRRTWAVCTSSQAGAAGKKVSALETFMAQYREGGLEKVPTIRAPSHRRTVASHPRAVAPSVHPMRTALPLLCAFGHSWAHAHAVYVCLPRSPDLPRAALRCGGHTSRSQPS
jgi:hypothetical protein